MDIKCVTNLDEYQYEKWPDQFISVPNINDRIRAESGKQLKVVRITHGQFKDGGRRPYIEIELHK